MENNNQGPCVCFGFLLLIAVPLLIWLLRRESKRGENLAFHYKVDSIVARREESARLEREGIQRAEEVVYASQLAEHRRQFRCHIKGCTSTSNGPAEGVDVRDPMSSDSSWYHYTAWDEPTGLQRCVVCGQYTCLRHLYRSVCKECVETRSEEELVSALR